MLLNVAELMGRKYPSVFLALFRAKALISANLFHSLTLDECESKSKSTIPSVRQRPRYFISENLPIVLAVCVSLFLKKAEITMPISRSFTFKLTINFIYAYSVKMMLCVSWRYVHLLDRQLYCDTLVLWSMPILRYDSVLLQASSQDTPVSAVVYAAAGWWLSTVRPAPL